MPAPLPNRPKPVAPTLGPPHNPNYGLAQPQPTPPAPIDEFAAEAANRYGATTTAQPGQPPAMDEFAAEAGNRYMPSDFPPAGPNEPGQNLIPGLEDPYQWVEDQLRPKPYADKFLAATVGQKELGPAGFPGFGLRATMGLSDTFEEKQREFKRAFPDGDMKQVNIPTDLPVRDAGQIVDLYRTGPDQPWARFDEVGTSMGDVADLSRAGVVAGAELGTAVATSGMSIPWQLMWAGLAAGGSSYALSELQRARGIKNEPRGTSLRRSVMDAFIADLGYTGSLPIQFLGRSVWPTAGLGSVAPEGSVAAAGAREQGFLPLHPFQLAENPLLQRMGQQAMTQTTKIGERVADQYRVLLGQLKDRVKQPVLDQTLDNMKAIQDRAELNLTRTIQTYGASASPEEAGRAIQQGLKEWDFAARQRLSGLFQSARQYGDMSFDLGPLKTWVQTIRDQQTAGQITNLPKEFESLMALVENAPRLLTDTTQGATPISAAEVLNAWRSHAFALGQQVPGQFRVPHEDALAKELFRQVSDVFDNPVGFQPGVGFVHDPQRQAFTTAWRTARDAAKERFNTLDALNKLTSATDREFAPVSLADSLMNGSNDDAVDLIHTTLQNAGLGPRWTTLQNAVRTKVFNVLETDGADAAERVLSKYRDKSQAQLVGGPNELQALRGVIDMKRQMDQLGLKDILREQTQATSAVMAMVRSKDKSGLEQLLKLPEDSAIRQQIRYGLLDYAYNLRTPSSAGGPLRGVEMLNREALSKFTKELENSGAVRFLHPDDLKFLKDAENYLRYIGPGADAGTSIVAGETAQGLTHITNPGLFMKTMGTIARMVGWGRFLSNGWGRYMILGMRPGRSDPVMSNLFRNAFGAMSETVVQLRREREQGLRGAGESPLAASVQEGLYGAVEGAKSATQSLKNMLLPGSAQ